MDTEKKHRLQTLLAAFPLPEKYIVLDVLTVGFQPSKHVLLAYAQLGEPTQRLGWLRGDYEKPNTLPAAVEFPKLLDKVSAQKDAYLTAGNVYNLPDEFLYDAGTSVLPGEAAEALYKLFLHAAQTLDTPHPVAVTAHNITCFTAPFITNLLNWHGLDGSVVDSVWQYDTAVITRAIGNDILPTYGEAWEDYSKRVATTRVKDKWNLASCRQEYHFPLDDQLDVLQNNVRHVECLLRYYAEQIAQPCPA